jgi:hypothetical protein
MAEILVGDHLIEPPHRAADVFRLQRPQVTGESVRALARRLGLPGERAAAELSETLGRLRYAERMQTVTVHTASGGFRFVDETRWHRDDGETDLAVDDAVARRLALDVLRRIDLEPADGESRFLETTALRVGAATREGLQARERTIDLGVAIQRVVDGVPVEGPGGKTVVYLDQKHDLSGLDRIWRPIEAAHRRAAPLRAAARAIEEMEAHLRDRQGRIQITEIRYGYFEQGLADPQEYLEPAWIVFGLLDSPSGASARRTIFVASALEQPMAQLTPPLASRRVQLPRGAPAAR